MAWSALSAAVCQMSHGQQHHQGSTDKKGQNNQGCTSLHIAWIDVGKVQDGKLRQGILQKGVKQEEHRTREKSSQKLHQRLMSQLLISTEGCFPLPQCVHETGQGSTGKVLEGKAKRLQKPAPFILQLARLGSIDC